MNELQYKPITGMINVNDIQEILENNRYFQEEIERLNNIINRAIEKAKTMKASMLIDTIDGIEIDSKFVHGLYALIEYMENELKGSDKE